MVIESRQRRVQELSGIYYVVIYDSVVHCQCLLWNLRLCDENILGGKIEIIPGRLVWRFTPPTGKVEEYPLGVFGRVPETDGFWGPAMVIDPKNPEHLENLREFREELASGNITR